MNTSFNGNGEKRIKLTVEGRPLKLAEEDTTPRCDDCGALLNGGNISRLADNRIVHAPCPARQKKVVEETPVEAKPKEEVAVTPAPEPPKKTRKPRAKKGETVSSLPPPPTSGLPALAPLPLLSPAQVAAVNAAADAEQVFHVPDGMEIERCLPMDTAVWAVSKKLGLPVLGGPSGRGWSFYSMALRCAQLFYAMNDRAGADGRELTKPAMPLQVGALYHVLQALYYGYGLGNGDAHRRIFYDQNGMARVDLVREARKHNCLIELPPDGADQLLAGLRAMIADDKLKPEEKPSELVLLEAEKLFDAHTNYYGQVAPETVEPLAIEWYARHPHMPYTCRYDAIMRTGDNDSTGLPPGVTVVHERKSAKWLAEWVRDGWFLDGEILGQILLWKPSGCEQLFGPLHAVVVDVVTKANKPDFLRIVVPAAAPAARTHEKWINYTSGQIQIWRATGVYPQNYTQCWAFGQRCGEWQNCVNAAHEG